MLVERGAKRVVCFDIVPKDKIKYKIWDHPAIDFQVGDITKQADVDKAIEGADCVWHLAAAVGPYHPDALYRKVNYEGTLNVITAMKKFGVKKLVMSSSPSTRFPGSLFVRPDLDGPTEDDMPKLPLKSYMARYAETKALAEMAVTAEVKKDPDFLAVNVAPHQVYGPRDNLFMPNMMETAISGKLRIFGKGDNRICFTHVDNYCHALIISERKLFKGSSVLGKFYVATDGNTHPNGKEYAVFWKELDKAVTGVGAVPLSQKMHLPFWLLYIIGLACEFFTWCTGITTKLNIFTVFVLTMNRWFNIKNIERDMEYKPIVGFEKGWADTITWFVQNWVPEYRQKLAASGDSSWTGIAAQSQMKIDTQSGSVENKNKKQ
jgi:nucleoside-diphosphate-sugar epimerase